MDHFRIRTTTFGEGKVAAESTSNDEPTTSTRPPFSSPPPPPPPIVFRESVFSRPILPATSSLLFLPPKPAAGPLAEAPNGSSGPAGPAPAPVDRYRECLRNHAACLGAHVVDGCGEFMPSGPPAGPLRCAACGCHRSFHRKEPEPLLLPPPPPPPPKSRESSSEERNNNAGGGELAKEKEKEKRFRTKFSGEQKGKMAAFAERVGWRVQKKDEAEMERFCREVGVSRRVLKVWMHNNKHLNIRTSKQQHHLDQQHQQYYQPQPAEAHGSDNKTNKKNKTKKKKSTTDHVMTMS